MNELFSIILAMLVWFHPISVDETKLNQTAPLEQKNISLKNKIRMRIHLEKFFPDFPERVDFEKKQIIHYKSALSKIKATENLPT